MIRIHARRVDHGKAVTVTTQGATIAAVVPYEGRLPPEQLPWLAPGLVDLQVNGYLGQEFNSLALKVEDVARISESLDRDGLTAYCPTSTTHSFEMHRHMVATVAAACEKLPEVASRVAGIHLEGPYISSIDGPRGAHPRQHVRPPDWDEFCRLQDAARGRIRILTMSPEYDGSAEFIAKVAATGVVVAIGHTNADSDQIRAAVDAGAKFSTHLGNGAHGQIRRHPNYIWDQLAEDRLWASLIVDGHHLPPSVVKCFLRAKTAERCLLVSDMTGLGGMPPGRYDNGGLGAVEVLEDGRLVIADQRQLLAGAALPMTVGIANLLRFTDVNLATAVEMASTRPAALIGNRGGELSAGSRADLVLFDLPGADGRGPLGDFKVRATINAGQLVFGELPAE